jgi:hypothetical protein
MKCENCSSEIVADSKFCSDCGNKTQEVNRAEDNAGGSSRFQETKSVAEERTVRVIQKVAGLTVGTAAGVKKTSWAWLKSLWQWFKSLPVWGKVVVIYALLALMAAISNI